MKKFALILGVFLIFSTSAKAEIYHGIDIDEVYKSSDWSSKEKIKEIIDDYTLLLQYQGELDRCTDIYTLDCLNDVSEKILLRFYSHNFKDNVDGYHNYVKATYSAYGILYCLNKYNIPPGTMCNQENFGTTFEIVKTYIQNLITQVRQRIKGYDFLRTYIKEEDN